MIAASLLKKKKYQLPQAAMWLMVFCFLTIVISSCVPKQPVEFRAIRNIVVATDSTGEPQLKGEIVLYNPNHMRMKLKEIKVDVFVDGKKAATVDQKPDLVIPAASEFSAFVLARLSLKEIGLLDAVLGLFGGKKYGVVYSGYVRVRVHGVTVKVPIEFKDELKLKL